MSRAVVFPQPDRDLDILKPLFETMRTEGPDLLTKNSHLAEEIRRTFLDVDAIEKELKKAAKAIESAKELASAYRIRLQNLCDSAVPKKIVQYHVSELALNS